MLNHTHDTPTTPSRVVLLGAGGFVGRTLMAQLEADGVETLGLTSANIDLTAPDAARKLAQQLRETDSLVILAALTPDKGKGRPPFLANLAMMNAVCDALGEVMPAHVIYISSDAVYPLSLGLVREDSPAQPTDLYGAMHLARELMIKEAATCPVAVLRPTLIYGAEDTHNSYGPNRFRRVAKEKGEITIGGNGEETRDHVLVDDVARLIAMVLAHQSSGLLNVATGTSHSFRDVAELVAAAFSPVAKVIPTERGVPITHRSFDPTACQKAFPSLTFTALKDGISLTHKRAFA